MKVYVETNWLLDLALEQERIQASSFVLELAKDNKVRLCLPAKKLFGGDCNGKLSSISCARKDES
ncbi:TPA: hypothetical protein EYP66_18820 [Candidatus Poribacteria bacterium]|nr:hypothetical protein [Candidatus Poribacteria bacterium]